MNSTVHIKIHGRKGITGHVQSWFFAGFLSSGFQAGRLLTGVGYVVSDRWSLSSRGILGVGVEPERKSGHLKAIPRLGEIPNTSKELAVPVADAVDAMDLGGLSRIKKTDSDMASPVPSGGDFHTPGRGAGVADGDEVGSPFVLLDEHVDYKRTSAGIDSSKSVGPHHSGHGRRDPLGVVALAQRLELGLVILKIVQDRGALMGLLEGKENGLVMFVLTGKGILELEDDMVDVEVSQIGHDVEPRSSG